MKKNEKRPMKILYSLAELGEFIGRKDQRSVRRWLARHEVPIERIGNANAVWLSDLCAAFPALEEGLLKVAGMDPG